MLPEAKPGSYLTQLIRLELRTCSRTTTMNGLTRQAPVHTLPPAITSCAALSNVTRSPVCIAAIVIQSAIEWLYPASTSALGVLPLRTHCIHFNMFALVVLSTPA